MPARERSGHTIAMSAKPSSSPSADVRAWHASADEAAADAARVARWTAWLTPAERVRYDGFHRDADRYMFLLGRVMARTLVSRAAGVPPLAWPWREGPHGRPEIDLADATLRFNVAHSAGLVICALADGRDVGVDVENLNRAPTDRMIVRRYCSPAEVADIDAQPDDGWHERFLIYWTLKEAYLKACGLGISVHLSDVSFTITWPTAHVEFLGSLRDAHTHWTFHLSRPTAGHLAAVAASRHDGVEPAIAIEPLSIDTLDRWTGSRP